MDLKSYELKPHMQKWHAHFTSAAVIELGAKITEMRWNTQENSFLYCKLIL